MSSLSNPVRIALWVQSVYYVLSGALPLVSMNVFVAITGPKTDFWLVKMVAMLAIVIGIALGLAAKRNRFSTQTMVLAAGSAVAFATTDVFYSAVGRISRIYLADAAIEAVLILVYCFGGTRSRVSVE